ncbi:MAG: PKD domain-containing protein [Candidatus Peregrinibacteria bacterium]|nr:PKD domain-containing protein [Candidatus Peregrinibacteria bacterium]
MRIFRTLNRWLRGALLLAIAAALVPVGGVRDGATLFENGLKAAASLITSSHAAAPEEEKIGIQVGEVFEIMGVASIPEPQFSWVLIQDRSFIAAGREQHFRVRLSRPGKHTLDANIYSTTAEVQFRKSILLDVQPFQDNGPGFATGGNLPVPEDPSTIVLTDPSTLRGSMVIPKDREIVRIVHARTDIEELTIDLDTTVDADEDGNPANDNDTAKTFIRTERTPLFLWFTTLPEPRTIRVTAKLTDGGTLSQEIRLSVGVPPSEVVTSDDISALETPDGTVLFTLRTENPFPETPLLYEWSFGDGEWSMLTTPEHRYAQSGSYTVHVDVVNLGTGQVIYSGDSPITVAKGGPRIPVPTQPTPGTGGEQPEPSGGGGGSILRYIVIAVIVLLVAMIIGALIAFLWKFWRNRRGGSLQETFEAMESKIMEKEGSGTPGNIIDVAPPLELTRSQQTEGSAPPEPVQEAPSFAPPPPPPSTPGVNIDEAPAWLKSGLSSSGPAEAAVEPPPTPEPTPPPPSAPPESPAPLPTESIPETPMSSTSAPAEESTLPPWLQQDASPPPSTLEPSPPSTPPELAPSDGPVPSWLQPSAPTEEPAPPPSPPEPPPAEAPTVPETPEPTEPPPQTPTPEPVPTPEPPPPPLPTPAPEPASSAMEESTPSAETSTEPELPAPAPEPSTPPPTLPAATPFASLPAPTPPPALPPPVTLAPAAMVNPGKTEEQLARERERKRRKRHRYQENLKRRKAEAVTSPTATVPAPAQVLEKETPPSVPVAPKLAAPKPMVDIPPVKPKAPEKKPKSDDTTIAIIRADSLEQQKPVKKTPRKKADEGGKGTKKAA